MKRLIFMIAMAMAIALQAAAMDRREARAEARYLTDKMAWELGLSAREYDRMYEINYRYLRGVNFTRGVGATATSLCAISSTIASGKSTSVPTISTVRCRGATVLLSAMSM